MATYTFGTVQTSHTDWLVQSASVNGSAQEALALNEKGEPVYAHYYQNVDEKTLEVIIPEAEKDIPKVGKVVKYAGKAWYVSSASTTETNTDFVRYSISLKRFTNVNNGDGLPAESDASESL